MTPTQRHLISSIATAEYMAERMQKIGRSEWALKWQQIANQLARAWKP